MVKVRLSRAGAKKRPFYHVVATDSRSPRDSKFIERLGYYNPGATGGEQKLVVDTARDEAVANALRELAVEYDSLADRLDQEPTPGATLK